MGTVLNSCVSKDGEPEEGGGKSPTMTVSALWDRQGVTTKRKKHLGKKKKPRPNGPVHTRSSPGGRAVAN